MKALEFYNALTELIPTTLSCSWDKDGLEACPAPDREVCRILIALDVTDDVVERAIEGGYGVILSHHPVFFGHLDGVSFVKPKGAIAVKLAKNDISVMSFHTRLDAVDGGVNDTLAALLGLKNVEKVEADADGIMRIGDLECEMDVEEYCRMVKSALSTEKSEAAITLSPIGKKVKKVALIGGGGGGYVAMAKDAGADTYVTGEMKYHEYLSAEEFGINLVTAGHFHTEYPVCKVLAAKAKDLCPSALVTVYDSNEMKSF